jgi:hypothetical protein
MKIKNQNIKAENILTDDSLIENLKNADQKDEHLPKEELILAQRIQRTLHVTRRIIRTDEKDLLGRSHTCPKVFKKQDFRILIQ